MKKVLSLLKIAVKYAGIIAVAVEIVQFAIDKLTPFSSDKHESVKQ